MSFIIVTDTAGNLPKRLADENDITVLPLTYRFGGKEYTCTDVENFDGAFFYKKIPALIYGVCIFQQNAAFVFLASPKINPFFTVRQIYLIGQCPYEQRIPKRILIITIVKTIIVRIIYYHCTAHS